MSYSIEIMIEIWTVGSLLHLNQIPKVFFTGWTSPGGVWPSPGRKGPKPATAHGIQRPFRGLVKESVRGRISTPKYTKIWVDDLILELVLYCSGFFYNIWDQWLLNVVSWRSWLNKNEVEQMSKTKCFGLYPFLCHLLFFELARNQTR